MKCHFDCHCHSPSLPGACGLWPHLALSNTTPRASNKSCPGVGGVGWHWGHMPVAISLTWPMHGRKAAAGLHRAR